LEVTQECSNQLRDELQEATAILRTIAVARLKPWKEGSGRVGTIPDSKDQTQLLARQLNELHLVQLQDVCDMNNKRS